MLFVIVPYHLYFHNQKLYPISRISYEKYGPGLAIRKIFGYNY